MLLFHNFRITRFVLIQKCILVKEFVDFGGVIIKKIIDSRSGVAPELTEQGGKIDHLNFR